MSILLLGDLRRIPVVVAPQKDSRRILAGLFRRKKMRMRFALVVLRAGTGRVVLGIVHSVDGMCFAGMPFAPASRINMATHFRVEIDHSGVRPPWTAKIDFAGQAGICDQLAVVQDKSGVFAGIMSRLSSDVTARMGRAMDLAMVEDRLAIAEDKIDVPGDIAV